MKKTISLILAVLLLCVILITPVLAHKANKSYGDVPKSADAIKIDGEKDAVYDKGLKLDIFRQYEGYGDPETDTRGTAWVLWQDGFLYVFGEIKQSFLQDKAEAEEKQSGTPWECDSLEVFLDFTNEAEGGDCDQFRIDAWGYRSFEQRTTTGDNSYGGDASTADGVFEGAAKINGTSYNVEFKIPFQHPAASGSALGFLLQINDMTPDGPRAMVFPSSSTGESRSWEAGEYDFIVLTANEVTAVEAVPPPEPEQPAVGGGDENVHVPEPTPAPAPTPSPVPPVTGDAGILFAFIVLSVSASVLVLKSKKIEHNT